MVRGGVRKEKIENIFMEYYGDIIFIIFLVLYFAYPLQFNVNHINPAILSNTSSQFVDKKIIKIEHFLY
jgi:hypothetical protein